MPPIFVSLNDDFKIDAGIISTYFDKRLARDIFEVTPPSIPMFDQVVDYLEGQPPASYVGIRGKYLGVGIAALCVRWGSYLATLMDANTLFHPGILVSEKKGQSRDVSWIDDAEMMRLNLEISYGLAQLCRIFHEDQHRYINLVLKAYHYLPMPIKSAPPNKELNEGLWQAQLEGSFKAYMKHHPEHREVVKQVLQFSEGYDIEEQNFHEIEPGTEDRIIGNFLAQFAWRNTSIEDYHAGQMNSPLLMPHQRRFTPASERKLLSELSGNMLVADRALWRLHNISSGSLPEPLKAAIVRYPESALALRNSTAMYFYYTYPSEWSLTEAASVVRL